ncbi:homeodomain-interacting protein kinase 2 [Fundulus heteroclitus]|uniref:homeodomain-interacting protein kinase 2 n=1 Tax=Fundulus heteroclitus TaxID=8078 RepID=UPI00165C1D5E|nr:homeodomain-interacting protein kinase 2 [Fundulus heteroclitus]XP_021174892.2 homeodomain-interacting protein kinase 2 [Fundulus heteroclitus]
MGNKSSAPSSVPTQEASSPLPHQYKIQKILGQGGSAVVFKCFDSQTNKNVALKFAKGEKKFNYEAAMMKFLMEHGLDQRNIIKFYHSFSSNSCLVFETCDITLNDYIKERTQPMDLQDIRTVIQQLATALDALRDFGIIHSDLKTDNIMLVDKTRKPLEVKLIDFGLAFFYQKVNRNINQCLFYRAPELILGLPYSAAVDIWSLGCVMARMLLNCVLFPGESEYENLRYMVDLMGPPPDHLINAGSKSAQFFIRTVSNQWILKRPVEYWGWEHLLTHKKPYSYRFLHRAKMSHLKFEQLAATEERRECIALVNAMLQWDAEKRITPKGILNHAFIVWNSGNPSSSLHESTTALGQEPNTGKESASSATMASSTGTSQEMKVANFVDNPNQGKRHTFDIAEQPKDKNLLPLPKIHQPPCEHLGQPDLTENGLLLRNKHGGRSTSETSSKSSINQEERVPTAVVVLAPIEETDR